MPNIYSTLSTPLLIKSTLITSLLLITTSCANFTTSTNLDPSNFKNYFAPGKVAIYTKVEDLPKEREFVGLIEGEDCQVDDRSASTDLIDARTDARRKARELEANAIIFSQCVNVEHRHCVDLLICYAHAYKIINDTSVEK